MTRQSSDVTRLLRTTQVRLVSVPRQCLALLRGALPEDEDDCSNAGKDNEDGHKDQDLHGCESTSSRREFQRVVRSAAMRREPAVAISGAAQIDGLMAG
jgi:hypothetical protein